MMAIARYLFLLINTLLLSAYLQAQVDTLVLKNFVPPLNRQLFHDYVNTEQKNALDFNSRNGQLIVSDDSQVNYLITQALTTKIDWFQYQLEKDTLLTHNKRVYYLRGLQGLLKYLQNGWKTGELDPIELPAVVEAYEQCFRLDEHGISIENYISQLDYSIAAPVVRSSGFDENPGIGTARNLVLLKYCNLHPSEALLVLKSNPDVPFADSLVRVLAKKYPVQLFSFAQANNKLGSTIRSIKDDPLVRTIATISQSRSGQQYFPFLDNIVKGKITLVQIDSIKDDSLAYYRLLVSTQMDYSRRAMNGDTAYEFKSLTERLATKARDIFVNTINGLHEEPDAIRFQCIQPLSAEELYYLAVLSDGLIYTSSYTRGVYPLMMKKINGRGDSLLINLHFDHYRKFISQAAAYNTLSDFLSSFPDHNDATALMQAFVGNLERSNELEDGVDVADSYASIIENNPKLATDVLRMVTENYQRNLRSNNRRGISIYHILDQLFLSADSSNNIDLTKELGIPPVYSVPFSSLVNNKGEVVIQVFFYGDKDGQLDYKIFQNMFNNDNWNIDKSNEQWLVVRSVKGKPVTIYANVPFDEETGEDDLAQQALGRYFEQNKISPTITINRGHSYHAETTISYMASTSRIVFMGSCGGFHLIDAILKKSEDAHIIASKQIGKRDINKPFLLLLTEKLRAGNDIDWIPFWKEFKNSANIEGFEDYIPPYKNLGAIFIKAYKKEME